MPRPISATIDLAALRHNLAMVRRHARRSRAFAVIKANGYGHGLERTARALREADGFALLEVDAAVRLREAGYRQRILLIEGFFDARELAAVIERRIAVVVHAAEQIGMLRDMPSGADLDVLLKVNTGMNRLGFAPARAPAVIEALRSNRGVGQITLMTHFANADDARGVAWQMASFERAAQGAGLPRSLANSAAILRFPETHCDWVRPGIMLYGCSPFAENVGAGLDLRPAMTLASELIAVQRLEAGDTVGYGGMFTARHDMRIGVVACGYADGYPRHAPNGTPVAVDGRLTGTVGRVSMDMLCVDLSGVPEAQVGSRVVIWGEGNPIEKVAAASGTVGYELMCALAPRVPVVERG
ncbi:MAG: alanine racemase [Betaproteobacteria bacterium]|nr:alanine racemase [Betaproteobacteria bacterium]